MINPSKNKLKWTFLTNHAHVLICLARNNSMLMKDIAREIGITERAVQIIISDLVKEGYINRIKEGRCNSYQINTDLHLRHPLESHCLVETLIKVVCPGKTIHQSNCNE